MTVDLMFQLSTTPKIREKNNLEIYIFFPKAVRSDALHHAGVRADCESGEAQVNQRLEARRTRFGGFGLNDRSRTCDVVMFAPEH